MKRASLLLAAIVATGLVVWLFAGSDESPPPRPATQGDAARPAEDPARSPLLEGRAARPADPVPEVAPPGVTPEQPDDGDFVRIATEEFLKAEAIAVIQERWQGVAPRAPGRAPWPSPRLGDPLRTPARTVRSILEEGLVAMRPLFGMAEVEREDDPVDPESEVETADEIEDPLVTAVLGTVVDAAGAPIAGAEVVLYSSFYRRHVKYGRHVREVGRSVAGDDGAFDLRPIRMDTVHFGADGEILLTVRHEGYAPIIAARQNGIVPEQENDLGALTLSPEALTLTGIIRDTQGRPVEGAYLRASGHVNPVLYDKTERQVILKDCPTAVTDVDGRYALAGLPRGRQHISIHVNIDCVWHGDLTLRTNPQTFSLSVLAGGSVRGRVMDPDGHAIAAAVLHGGGNSTHSYADGTYWLDNITQGPFTLWVVHHLYRAVQVPGVMAGEENRDVVLDRPLPRVTLIVTEKEGGTPIDVIAIDWRLTPGGPPRESVPDSPFWHRGGGHYEVVVPERARGAFVSAEGYPPIEVAPDDMKDGAEIPIQFEQPESD